jgi:hypothetical protein
MFYQGQGDQIGRIFAYWVIVFFGHRSKNYRSPEFLVYIFYTEKVMYYVILPKIGLGHTVAIFSQTLLVPLIEVFRKVI